MKQIVRSALVPYRPELIYAIINDVQSYPRFLDDCVGARILESSEHEMLAELELARGGVRRRFTTRNRLVPHESIRMELEEGPFRHLSGEWRLTALGDAGCKVEIEVILEAQNRVAEKALALLIGQSADRLVDSFCRRADSLHGS